MKKLEGKSIIVTGAGRGIGARIADDLAEHGARVCVADIDSDNADEVASRIQSSGGEALGITVDVGVRESVQEMVMRTVESFGSLDVIFNNAGISQASPFMEVTEIDFNRIMKVNGLGVLLCTQEAASQMIKQGKGGKIINTSSIAGKQGYPLFAHYCASKFAVVALTQAAARALAEHKITVNCFGPGVVHTELWEQLDQEFQDLGVTSEPEQAINEFSEAILLGRYSTPDDIIGLTSFLASRDSNYITGQTLMIDGGMVLI